MAETEESGVMSLTVTLLSAYFANNTVPSSDLPALVEGTRRALLGNATAIAVSAEAKAETPAVEAPTAIQPEAAVIVPEPVIKPAVTIEASLASPDHIVSLIDGKPYKALKRHLSAHGLTPVDYRARYDLPADYPMVAPGYSAARREVALKLGLGGKRKSLSPSTVPEPEAAPVSEPAPSAEPVVAAESASEQSVPVRPVRAKAKSPAAAAPDKGKRKGGKDKTQPAVVKAAPKPRRSRAAKAETALGAPPVEPTPADVAASA